MRNEDTIEAPHSPRANAKHRAERSAPEDNSTLYYVMIGMVVLLLIFSVVQTTQIMSLKSKVQSGSVTTAVASGAQQPAAPAPRPAASPQMVGGC